MRKILITSLGSGNKNREYFKANYDIEGTIYEDEVYVASALEKHFHIDKTFYIGTFGSMWENIYAHYCEKFAINKDEEYELEIYEKMIEFLALSMSEKSKCSEEFIDFRKFKDSFQDRVIPIIIKYGLDDLEIFQNFNNILKIIDELEDGDKLYLDITHSFRSNAFWLFLVMNYINDVIDRQIDIEYISYGMFEAKEKKDSKDITPVINLNVFFEITKWIKGAYTLKTYGNSDLICSLIEDKQVKNKIENLSNAVNINYISSVRESIKSLYKNYEMIQNIDGLGKLIIPNVVSQFLTHFKDIDEDYEMFFKLGEWHFKEKRYAIAFTNIVEAFKAYAIYSGISNEDNITNELKNLSYKLLISKAGKKELKNEYRNFFDKKTAGQIKDFFEKYEICRKIRNNIAHSDNKRCNPQADINSLENILKFLKEIFKDKEFLKKCREYIMI